MELDKMSSPSADSEVSSKNTLANSITKVELAWKISLEADAGLFSSSLPVLPHENLVFADSEHVNQCFDDDFPSLGKAHLVDAGKSPLVDIGHNAIGNLLPGDEEELLAGIMEDFDLSELPTQMEDVEDDLFGSGGGFEMDFDPGDNLSIGMSKLTMSNGVLGNDISHYGLTNGIGTIAGEHPFGEHPSRTLFVRNINSNVDDSELRSLFEQFGDIRSLYTACKHRGFVMISYYDIRDARTAIRALQNKPLRRRKLDIHFSIPKDNPSEKDINQGTLVVFNLDPSVSNDDLRQIFAAYGEVKEIRETPHKRHHKFIEFYDVRAAEAALKALNRSDIAGKRIKLEPSRPGGARRNLMQQASQDLEIDEGQVFRHQVGSPLTSCPPAPGNWPPFGSPVDHNPLQSFTQSSLLGTFSPANRDQLPGLNSVLSSHVANPMKITPIGKDHGRPSHVNQEIVHAKTVQGVSHQHSQTFPEQRLSASPRHLSSFDDLISNSSVTGMLSGPQFLWGSPTSYSESNGSAWGATSVGHPYASSGHVQGYPYSCSHESFVDSHQHVGSAPSGFPFDRRFGFLTESPEISVMSRITLGGVGSIMRPSSMTDGTSPSCRRMPLLRNHPLIFGNGSYHGAGMPNLEGLTERGGYWWVENNGNQIDNKKQYQLDLNRIISGEDSRTTLMIKNIPNKYTSRMLLAAIDENNRGTYDFLYLPIDFKNKCNVGYAFINMASPSHIISFHKVFNGKRWEKFNSEKVASLAYARIQGKAALVSHFQNSSLMNEDKSCRPILFQSEGQEMSDQESLPTSNLNICIRLPDGSYSGDYLDSPKGNADEKPENN